MSESSGQSRRSLVRTSSLGAGIVLVLVLLGLVNYFGWKYHKRLDWTSSRIYSLSETSRNVLADLDRDVEAVVFMDPGSELYGPVGELLARYESQSPRIVVREIDPVRNQAEAQSLVEKYGIEQVNVVVFVSGEDRRVVDAVDLADYDYSGMQYGAAPQMTGFKGEQLFTSAILQLAESRKPRILFTTGHGEIQLDDYSQEGLTDLQELLGRDNVEFDEWASLGQAAVPEGTDLLVIAGATSAFVEPEREAIRSYLEGGGRLLVLLDPVFGGLQSAELQPLLADYGVQVGTDIVVDPANPLPFFGADTIFVGSFGAHEITRSLNDARLQVILPLARSVSADETAEGFEIVELLETSSEGWGETDLANLGAVAKGEDDVQGPVSLAVAVTAGADDAEPAGSTESGAASDDSAFRLVVFGDTDFLTNGQIRNASNAVLAANTLNWLVSRESLVGIPPRNPDQTKLTLTSGQLAALTWLVMAVLPSLAIALGVVVYFKRRR